MNRTTTTIVGILALAAVPLAFAGGRHHKGHPDLSDRDGNDDGKVTLEEFREAHEKMLEHRFSKLDKDGDGAVTKAEMDAAHEKFRKHHRRGGEGAKDKDADSES